MCAAPADTDSSQPTAARAYGGAPGLTAVEVAERVATGRTNATRLRTSRSTPEIIRANTLTVFNGLLGALFLLTLLTGRWQNSLFGGVIIANAAIGIAQELRAKHTLDRLAILNLREATVVRDGLEHTIAVEDVVQDDVVRLRTGDQVAADGQVLSSAGLELDESLLTGESEPVVKEVDDAVRSGSIVVAGQGSFTATGVGPDAYANRLAAEARRFGLTRSELVAGTNRLLRWISVLMVVVGPLVLWSQFRTDENRGWQDAVTGTVAALVGMVPEGLVLLTSLAFMVATVTLARRKTLVQELPAVEGLARVDVVCLDKTGTLTYGDVEYDDLRIVGEVFAEDVHAALALFGQSDSTNAVAAELARVFGRSPWTPTQSIPFSSARKWSAAQVGDCAWVLGAPEIVGPGSEPANVIAASGSRVLALARGNAGLADARELPTDLETVALVTFTERIREDVAQTLAYFAAEHVALKVISGDNPRTVGAIAARVGLPGVRRPEDAVDARELPDDPDELAQVVETHSVFGRVTPHQKRAIVSALQSRGHVVAMTGDGVNDAIALKGADIGVAMGSGSPATRAVAQLVLLDNRFAHLPDVVAEGRRVAANIERAASLFLVKNVYSLVLALISAATLASYPLAPIQLTLVSTLTIGVPGFVLALAPNLRRYVSGFMTRVLRFSVPVGVVIGVCSFAAYRLTRVLHGGSGVSGGRTVAALTVLVMALWTLAVLARPWSGWKAGLIAGVTAATAGAVAIPAIGHGVFLLNATPTALVSAACAGGAGIGLIELVRRFRLPVGPIRRRRQPTPHGADGPVSR